MALANSGLWGVISLVNMERGKKYSVTHTGNYYLTGLKGKIGKKLEFPLVGEGFIKKQTSGRCKFGRVKLIISEEVETLEYNSYVKSTISFEVDENKIPKEFWSSIDIAISNFSLIYNLHYDKFFNFKIIDGDWHPVDSDGISFEIATYLALVDAFK